MTPLQLLDKVASMTKASCKKHFNEYGEPYQRVMYRGKPYYVIGNNYNGTRRLAADIILRAPDGKMFVGGFDAAEASELKEVGHD